MINASGCDWYDDKDEDVDDHNCRERLLFS